MKFRCCLLLLSVIPINKASAQFNLFAGPQVTTARYEIRGAEQATTSKTGFMAGVGFATAIEGNFYFAPQIFFSRKGYSVTFDRPAYPPDSAALNNDVTLNTLEAGLLFQLNLSKKPNHFFVRIGPSFDFNLSGTERFDTAAGRPVNRKMPFDFGGYSYVTALLHGHVGYQHQSGLTITAQYAYGVGSLNNADDGPRIYHRVAVLSLGWRLGRK